MNELTQVGSTLGLTPIVRNQLILGAGIGKTAFLANATAWQQVRADVRQRIALVQNQLTILCDEAATPIQQPYFCLVEPKFSSLAAHVADTTTLAEHLLVFSRLFGTLRHLSSVLNVTRSVLSRLATFRRNAVTASQKAVSERKFFVLHETHPPAAIVFDSGLLAGAFQAT